MPDPDVLIVGAGPSGAVAAKRLAEEGFAVTVLEQGDWPDYGKARPEAADFDITATRDWAWDPNARAGKADYPIDDSESDITALMWNGVGGGTIVYAAQWQRNMPSDFRVRSLDGIADDWPLTYEELEPYYVRVEKDFGISGVANDTAFPPGEGPPLPAVPLGPAGRKVARAHNELGWHWWPAPNAIATRAYGALSPCVQRGVCLKACKDRAKGTVDITHWPVAQDAGVELITKATVREVTTNAEGLATGVVYLDDEGAEHALRAGVVILAANGIGTPRLLLMSGAPDGLANSSGLVGKRLMMHPFGTVVGLFEDELESWQGPWGQWLHSLEFYETDESRGFVRGAKWGLQPTGAPLSMTTSYPWGAENPIWGPGFHEGFAKRFGRSAMWGIIAEDLPEESNRVVLGDGTDRHGIRGAKIVYEMSENSTRLMHFHEERAAESLRAAGAYETVIAPQIRATGWHLLGTAKMGTDPATSVVDAWGRTHDVPNLFVFDGSVWPTSAGMNPTATIAAMSLRMTEALIASRREQAVAA
ncbi:MAG: GMC family oxidoreductase [Solirubrobacteraceae bacterium]